MTLITDTGTLAAFCRRVSGEPYLTVDTEFMREKTYWPILCVVQVGAAKEATAIDALAPGIDLGPLFELLARPETVKVFHAARQDLEIFYHLTGSLPAPVFDTQVAAMVLGFGEQVGYEGLVAKTTRGVIDKSSRFTDWAHRPLSEKQIHYAISDVTHLRPVYEKLRDKLAANGRASWLDEEMAVLTADETYAMDPDKAYLRIKSRGAKPRFLAVLREVAAWRERQAQRLDIPRNRVLREESLIEVAHHLPKTTDQLARTRGLGRGLAEGKGGKALLEAVQKGLATPEDRCPRPKVKPDLPRGIGPVTDLLKVLLKMKCEESDVAPKLLASAAQVELIAAFGEDADVPALHGWRREVYGEAALKLRRGELALSVQGRKLALTETA